MLRPKAFEHIGIIVADLDRSVRFYAEGLGLELLRRRGAGGEGFAALKAGDTEINVFCNPNSTALGSDGPQRIDHLCLSMESASIADLIVALREVEIPIASGPVERSDGTALFVHDPDGIRVELLVKR
jgi:catechol 2,3-dioxygenase-like lactoylglutathione lyase family enzyme